MHMRVLLLQVLDLNVQRMHYSCQIGTCSVDHFSKVESLMGWT